MAVDCERTPGSVLLGTPEFMAPEQVTAPDAADCRADIYALGVLLYEMLAGHGPFETDALPSALHRVVHDAPPMLDVPVPPALERLLFDGLLVKSRDRRLQTMGEVAAALDALLAAARSEIPGALDTLEERSAGLTTALGRPIWASEGSCDDVPVKLEDTSEPALYDRGIWHDRDLRGLLGDKYDRLGPALRRRLARHIPPARLAER
jgi:serine/threonine protein kinase